jgi:DNA (cytosine-5)-methyltransferase 1
MMKTFIELFAGCGGMSLGLKAAGFNLVFANELSPMAGETYAYNLFKEDLKGSSNWENSLWIKSHYEKGDTKRLLEDPRGFQQGEFKDIDGEANLQDKLIIGDINDLIDLIIKRPELIKSIQGKIDLVSGGPPCQSFSLAGKREKNHKRNTLPLAFANFVNLVKPKLVILENVTGILRAFKEADKKYYAWFEVAKAFGRIGYIPICMHINAKYYGLPQNRPRFILLGIREDLYKDTMCTDLDREIVEQSLSLVKKVRKGLDYTSIKNFKYYDINSPAHFNLFLKSKFLPQPIVINKDDFINVEKGIDNLKNAKDNSPINELLKNEYDIKLEDTFGRFNYWGNTLIKNHNHRTHSEIIQNRFKLLRIIEEFDNGTKKKLTQALQTGTIVGWQDKLTKDVLSNLRKVGIMKENEKELETFFFLHRSKKQSQRALIAKFPAPATLSIPDDVCHYDPSQNRTLTVREMARIQSFPDWFEFRSKDTTGGTNRQAEVPNYTQVGNAVPPLLGKALGDWISSILKLLNHEV